MALALFGWGTNAVATLVAAAVESTVLLRICDPWSAVAVERVGSITTSILGTPALIAFLMWVSRATANLRTMRRPIEWSPTAAVVWCAVPVANIYVGYRILSEIARRSRVDEETRSRVFVWWVMRVAASALAWTVFFARRGSPDLETWRRGILLMAAGGLFQLVEVVMAARVMYAVTRAQSSELEPTSS